MNFTQNYPILVDAITEVQFRIAFNPTNVDSNLDNLQTLKRLAKTVTEVEIEAGNAVPFERKDVNDLTSNVAPAEFYEKLTEQNKFYAELANITKGIEGMIEQYEAAEESGTLDPMSQDFKNAYSMFGETDIVPISEFPNPVFLAQHINKGMERIMKYTEGYDEAKLAKEPFLNEVFSSLVADVTYEVTETERTDTYSLIRPTDEFEARLKKLGLSNFAFSEYMLPKQSALPDNPALNNKITALLSDLGLAGKSSGSISGSNVFGKE